MARRKVKNPRQSDAQRHRMMFSPEEREKLLVETMQERGEGGLQQNVNGLIRIVRHSHNRDMDYYHVTDSRKSKAGFPDLIITDGVAGRIIVSELKRQKEKPSPDQVKWLNAFAKTGICEVYLWRPEHFYSGVIMNILLNEDTDKDTGEWEIPCTD